MRAYSEGHYYTCYTLQTCQPHQNLPQQLFTNDTAVVATDSDPTIASHKLETNLLATENWFKKWGMKANGSKSIYIAFTTRKEMCPRFKINNVQLPQKEEVKYLRLHLDRRLTWFKHVFAKWK
jgi:tRNA splicing ligase